MNSDRAVGAACVVALALSGGLGALAPGTAWSEVAREPPARPSRIVSLSVPGDEILLALVADRSRILALEEWVDDESASNASEEARSVPGRMPMIAESILAARPDLVLMPPWADATVRALLAHQGVPVHPVSTPRSLEDVRTEIRALGRVVDEDARAEALIAEMDARLDAVRARGDRSQRRPLRVLLWSWSGHASGSGTVFSELVALAGGIDAASEAGLTGYAPLTIEALLEMDPDALVIEGYRADAGARDVVPDPSIERDPRFRTLRAVRDHRVLSIPSARLLATSHHVAALAEDLERALERASARPAIEGAP